MSSNKSMFSSTRHKIAFFFSLLSSIFLIANTLIAIVLLRFEITRQAKLTLQSALTSVQADYQANRLNGRVSSVFQLDTANTSVYESTQRLPNVRDSAVVSSKDQIADQKVNNYESQKKSLEMSPTVSSDSFTTSPTVSTLEKNRQVYSRVIAANGDILFTSDLFEAVNTDPKLNGFFTFESDNYCFHVMTSLPDKSGSIVQVGQYCTFTFAQQISMFLNMLVVTSLAVVLTYFVGWLMSGLLLKPFEKVVQQTRQFAENCYHELMTPLSVAMSSVSAAMKEKKYKEGLESVDEDLREVYFSLQTLSAQALKDQVSVLAENVDVSAVIQQAVKKMRALYSETNVNLQKVQKNIYQKAQKGSLQIIIENLLQNAIKYSNLNSEITVNLDNHLFSIENEIADSEITDTSKLFKRGYRGTNAKHVSGNGFGLAIVKELAEANGWKVEAKVEDSKIRVTVRWN